MAVLRPLKVIIDNYPEGEVETLDAINHPDRPDLGSRKLPFGREIYIERDDFMEEPPKKFFRLAPGREVRLRYAYFITCRSVERDASGEIVALHCTYDPASRGGNSPDGRKVQGTIHWVSATGGIKGEIKLYEQLFAKPDPDVSEDIATDINPSSLETLTDCWLEPALADAKPGVAVQFERLGYFCPDRGSTPSRPVFNRTVGLRDSWGKLAAALPAPAAKISGTVA